MLDINKMSAFVEGSEAYCKPLDEATYFGRNRYLNECEEILDEMIRIAHTEGEFGVMSESFARMMAAVAGKLRVLYGFYDFTINESILSCIPPIGIIVAMPNAATVCKSAVVKYTQKATGGTKTWEVDFDKTHKGIQFAPSTRQCLRMWLGVGLFMDYGEYSLTGAEILAIILHEIGHNFYVGPVREFGSQFLLFASMQDLSQAVLAQISMIILTEGSNAIDNIMPADLKKSTMMLMNSLGVLLSPVIPVIGTLNTIKMLGSLAAFLSGLLISTVAINTIKAILKYDSEKYSDAFATSYGYGAELSSALSKMEHVRIPDMATANDKKKQDIIEFVNWIIKLPVRMIMSIVRPDEHPNTTGRLRNDIKYMEAAGKKISDPKLRKEYENQLTAMYRLREQAKLYQGANVIHNINKVEAIIQDTIHLSDTKDIFSSLRPSISTYRNLDRPG